MHKSIHKSISENVIGLRADGGGIAGPNYLESIPVFTSLLRYYCSLSKALDSRKFRATLGRSTSVIDGRQSYGEYQHLLETTP